MAQLGARDRRQPVDIKLSSLVSDLLGTSARRMLQALAEGETNPATLAPHWRISAYAPPRTNCATPSVRGHSIGEQITRLSKPAVAASSRHNLTRLLRAAALLS